MVVVVNSVEGLLIGIWVGVYGEVDRLVEEVRSVGKIQGEREEFEARLRVSREFRAAKAAKGNG